REMLFPGACASSTAPGDESMPHSESRDRKALIPHPFELSRPVIGSSQRARYVRCAESRRQAPGVAEGYGLGQMAGVPPCEPCHRFRFASNCSLASDESDVSIHQVVEQYTDEIQIGTGPCVGVCRVELAARAFRKLAAGR